MNLYTWPPFLAFWLNLFLAGWALLQAEPTPLKRRFAWWNLCVAAWNLATFVMHGAPSESFAMTAGQAIRNVFLFIYPTFLDLILEFTKSRTPGRQKVLVAAYISSGFLVLCNQVPGWMVKGLSHHYWGYYPQAGPAAGLYTVFFFATFIYALVLLARAARTAQGHARLQAQYFFMATVMVFVSIFSNFLLVFGWSVYPIGSLFNVIFSLLLTYAIATYGLMEMQVLLRQSVVYGLLGIAFTGVFGLVELVLKRMLFEQDTMGASFGLHAAAVPITLALALPMRSLLEPVARFLGVRRAQDWEGIQKEFSQSILTILDLEALAKALTRHVANYLGAETAILSVREGRSETFVVRGAMGAIPAPFCEPTAEVIAYCHRHPRRLNRDQLRWEIDNQVSGRAPSSVVDWVEGSGYPLWAPLFFRDELMGFLGIGVKRSGEIFTADDDALLSHLLVQMAVAVSNARALQRVEEQQRQLDQQQEMALMGTVATEMAHELNKPLTHIMNAGHRLGVAMQGESRDNLKTITSEVKRASEILDGFAMLSPSRTLQRDSVRLEDLLEEALAVVGIAQVPAIRIERHFVESTPVRINPGQMLQVFTNLIQNAWDAMGDHGVLSLTVEGKRTDHALTHIEVAVADTGNGIPAAYQEKVFEPFFTTKRSRGGRGLGLAISRAMVLRHEGVIRMESPIQNGRGTRAIVILPVRTETEM